MSTVIRKYPNRRLYDTSAGRYVNLDDVAALVRQGVEIQVVDAKTGEDVTRVVLTQIIVEDAKEQPSALPTELLKGLILNPLGLMKNLLTPPGGELDDLRRRVADLEARMPKPRPRRPKPR